MNEVVVLTETLSHPEGPAVLPDGRVVFVETFLGQLTVWDSEQGVQHYADVGGGPNSCTVGLDGVYVAQNGGTAGEWHARIRTTPSIQRIRWDGRVQVVTATADGEPLHAPNDLVFGPDGLLYFTDPGEYNLAHPTDGRICVVHADGTASVVAEVGPTYPNGIGFEQDGSIVWDESYTRRVCRRRPNGSVEVITTLPAGRVPDGLKVSEDDRIYVTGGPVGGIDVISPDGELLEFLDTGGDLTNCVFDGHDLYVTCMGTVPRSPENLFEPSGGRLLRTRLGVAGKALASGAIAT